MIYDVSTRILDLHPYRPGNFCVALGVRMTGMFMFDNPRNVFADSFSTLVLGVYPGRFSSVIDGDLRLVYTKHPTDFQKAAELHDEVMRLYLPLLWQIPIPGYNDVSLNLTALSGVFGVNEPSIPGVTVDFSGSLDFLVSGVSNTFNMEFFTTSVVLAK